MLVSCGAGVSTPGERHLAASSFCRNQGEDLGVSRYSVIRLLDTFFRRWWLYLVPFVLLCGLGAFTVANKAATYKSTGSVYVASSTLLQKINGTASNNAWETAAVSTSKQINSQLGTDQFIRDIATRAGIDSLIVGRVVTIEKVRSWILAYDTGPNLINVVVTSDNAQISQRLAQATIDGFIQSVVDVNLGDSEAAIAYLDGVLATAQDEVTAAQQALDDYLVANPSPGFGQDRPDEQVAQITRLNDAVDQATSRYDSAYDKREDAKLSTEQTKFDLGRQLRIVDAPQVPTVPESGKKALVMGFGVFAAMGVFLSLASVVVAATLDHGIRYASDVRNQTGLRVLATVPRSKVLRTPAPKRSRSEMPTIERQRLAPGSTPTRTAPARRRPATAAAAYADRRPAEPATHAPVRTAAPARPPVTRPAAARPSSPPVPPPPPGRPAAPAAHRDKEAVAPRVEGEVDAGSWSRRRRPADGDGNGASGTGWPPGRRRGGDVPHAS